MFDWVQNNRRIIQIALFLFLLPFAFVGVDTYFRGGDFGNEVARVDGYRISPQEFQQSLRERQDAMQRMLGGGRIDTAMLDSPEMRFAAIEQIVRDRLLLSQSVRNGIMVTDEALRDLITNQEAFKENGVFSRSRFNTFLQGQGLTVAGFESRVRRDLLLQPLRDAFVEAAFVPNTVAERLVRLSEQTRELSFHTLAVEAFASKVEVTDAAVKAYYDSNKEQFQIPEQVRVEYVALSLDNLAAQTPIGADDAKRAYDQNPARFSAPEEREASHILVRLAAGASPEATAAARAKAEDILKRVRAKPQAFGDVAKAESEDSGSAAEGGVLGFLPRGATKKSFDDALFAMKPGEIVGPVQTEFGLHVIRLGEVRGGRTLAFDEVKSQLEAEIKRQQASKQFAELAEKLSNVVYEQSDSLGPAAELLKVSVQQSPWLTRKPVPGSPLGNERFLNALFSEDVLKNKRNSEAIEVAQGTIVAARILEHKPSASRPFDEVISDIRKRLVRDESVKQAAAQGRVVVERLRKGEDGGLAWTKPQTLGRAGAQGAPEAAVQAAFRAEASKMPAYVGVEDPGVGYHIVRISAVNEQQSVPADVRRSVAEQIRQFASNDQLENYVALLKAGIDVKIKPGVIEKK